ncbi:DMT family transporter [Brevibacillus sp. SYSU BS000544]|uniref:DMT family transporter n=1 Tax=Brevibacillus sp. SYSU BS000544 TaxID=3416443 RepID=UPI003CE549B0
MYIAMALLTGVLVIMSFIINSNLAKQIGVFQGTLINYIVGLICSVIVWIIASGTESVNLGLFGNVPMWAFIGGGVGVMIVVISNILIPTIPAVYSTLLIFIGQLSTSVVIDYFAGNEVTTGKIVGGLLILSGLFYNFMIDNRATKQVKATSQAPTG